VPTRSSPGSKRSSASDLVTGASHSVDQVTGSARRALRLAIISGGARAPGFLVPVLIAGYYGAGSQTDAYFIAYSAALLVGGTLAQGIDVAIVPFAAVAIGRGGGVARDFLDGTALRVLGLAGVLWAIAFALAVLASKAEMRSQVAFYSLGFAPLVVLWNASAVYSGGLISQDAIGLSTASMLCRGVGGLGVLMVAPRGLGLIAVALGIGLGELFRAWWLRARLLERLIARETDRSTERVTGFGSAATAQVLAGLTGGAAPVVERFLATSLEAGTVSRLEYASRLLVIPGLIFDGALGPLLLARWSQTVATSGRPPSRAQVLRAVGKGTLLAIAIGCVGYIVAGVAVQVLLHHGRFRDEDAGVVTSLLRLLLIGYVASMGAVLLERYYLACVKNRLLAALSLGRLSVRVLTALVLLPSLGVFAFGVGFAAAEFGYMLVLALLLPGQHAP